MNEMEELKAKSKAIRQRMEELRHLINEKKKKNLDTSEEIEEWNRLFDEKMKIVGNLLKLKENLKNEKLKEMVERFEKGVSELERIDEKIEEYTREIRKLKEEKEYLECKLTEMVSNWQKSREKVLKLKGMEITTITIDKAIKEFIKEKKTSVSSFINEALQYYLYHKYLIKIVDYEENR